MTRRSPRSISTLPKCFSCRAGPVAPGGPPAAQRRADAGQQLLQPEGLHHVVVGAQRQPGHLVGLLPLGRQDEDGHVRVLLAQLPDELEAAQPRQHHVHDEQVGALGAGDAQPLLAVGGGADLVALHGQVEVEPAQDGGVVLDDQDPLAAHGLRASDAGSSTVKAAPFPSSLFTLTFPPWASTTCFTMESPRPLPSMVRSRGSLPR